VLNALLSTIDTELARNEKISLLRKVGIAIAKSVSLTPSGHIETNVKEAVAVVTQLGRWLGQFILVISC
jgi:hypothetical protein